MVKRVDFPKGSKPYMLRLSPDATQLWVQAVGANTNNILDPDTLEIKESQVDGKGPVTNAWSPDGRFVFVTHGADVIVTVYDAKTEKVLKRIDVGQNNSNIAFTPDSKKAYVTVTGTNSVAVIDMASLAVSSQVKVGKEPQGLVLLPAAE